MKSAGKIVVLSTIAVVAMFTISTQALACSADGKEGFLPRNSMYIPTTAQVLDRRGIPIGGGISEAEFNGVISAVDAIYKPIIKAMGGNLVFKRNWTDGTVNAYADRQNGNWNVSMFGGLARHKETTVDGFLLVVCHELGHHIGGAPKYAGGNDWASNEGQSDYFATLKCARRVLKSENNLRALQGTDAPDSVRKACRSEFRETNAAAACVRSSLGGKSLARLLASLGNSKMPEFETPDMSKVKSTDDSHPEAQCRLDTYFAGATCDKDFNENVSDTDPTVGTCSMEKGATVSFRPLCWYAPKDNNGGKKVDPRAPFPGRLY